MAENSPIRNKGIGKDAKRHDLDGTPGLSNGSSLNQGDVQQLEAGQKAVENTQAAQTAIPQGQPLPQQPADGPVQAPDPVQFAMEKVGGGLQLPTEGLTGINTAQWLPMMEAIARSGDASPMLRRAYVNMLQRLQSEPFSGSTAVVNKRELDRQVHDGF